MISVQLAVVVVTFPIAAIAALCGTQCDLYSLKWQQEFEESTVDNSVWNFRLDQKAYSAQLAANVEQADGNLVVNLKKQKVGNYNYTGGGVISKAMFHYGYFESQIQMNSGQGWHSSFWLMAGNGSSTFNTAPHTHSEIDIFERDSIYTSAISHNINLWNADGSRYQSYGSGTLSTTYKFAEWHVFGALWAEDTVTFFIDGVQSANLSLTPTKWTHNYLNIWITSLAYGQVPDDSALPSKIQSSYVRYYQKDYYLTAGTLCFQSSTSSCASNQGYKETGVWATSSLDGYTKGIATRYCCHSASAKATWSLPTTVSSGTYDVWVWVMARSDSDPSVSYSLTKNGAIVKSSSVDQTSGNARWALISSGVAVTNGQTWAVIMTASGSGCARADAVKFVRTA